MKDFIKRNNLDNDTKKESELKRVFFPRDSKINSDKRFVNIDNGSQGGSHWTCFLIKDKRYYYFASFGGAPDSFLLN